jgi:hypothetical protein
MVEKIVSVGKLQQSTATVSPENVNPKFVLIPYVPTWLHKFALLE